jgi:lipoprotein-releasing system permease protein
MITWIIVSGYLKKSNSQKNISWMILICFLTTALTSCALCLALAIMKGFEQGTHQKMQGIHSHLTISASGQSLQAAAIEKVIKEEFPLISHTAICTIREGLIRNPLQEDETPKAIFIIGIDPATYRLVSSLESTLINTSSSLVDAMAYEKIIVGKRLANNLSISFSDSVECLVGSDEQSALQKFTFETKEAAVGGIFKTGIDEYDSHAIFCSFSFLKNLFPDIGVERINCAIKNQSVLEPYKKELQNRLHLSVFSWKDLYPALVSALELEKKVGFLIFALILFIACMNNASLLIMYINHKKKNIALLQSIGCPLFTIQSIFLLFVTAITTTATLAGILIAGIISLFINTYKLFPLPDAYYITHLTFIFDWKDAMIVLFTSLLITLLISYITTRLIKNESIAHILRFE